MKLTFWGAAGTVTGSMHEIALNGNRYLLDCGLYQGRRQMAREINSTFPFDPAGIDAVLLSHAHIDHSGNLPTLVKKGFAGPIYATPATVDLCAVMLPDSAHVQEKDAEFIAKRNARRRSLVGDGSEEPVKPLYTTEEAEAAVQRFKEVPQNNDFEPGPGLVCHGYDAGHMLGSIATVLEARSDGGRPIKLAFSGDVGRKNLPITRDPEPLPSVDYLIMESTYGDRLHKDDMAVADKLADTIQRTAARGGKIVCPSFAVGRTQQIILLLHQLYLAERIPGIPVFVDSPLAINSTKAFRENTDLYDAETAAYMSAGLDPFSFRTLRYVKDVAESKAINDLQGPCIIISASGMAEAGRILHHLRNNIGDRRNTVLITGFQAENTLGRKIVDKHPEVPIFGEPMPLRAEVVKINELSGHADQRELIEWMQPMVSGLKHVYLVHGEPAAAATLARVIEQTYKLPVTVAKRGESHTLA